MGLLNSLILGVEWARRGLPDRLSGSRGRWGPAVRTLAIAAVLLDLLFAVFIAVQLAVLFGATTRS